MNKRDLLNKIYIEIFQTIKYYDYKLFQEIGNLSRFKKTNIICELAENAKENINKIIHTYENEKEENKITDKFGYRKQWENISPVRSIKKKELLDEYCNCLERLTELNSELYNMTELYEGYHMLDFSHELFNIFKNKLGYYTKLRNTIKQLY